MMSPKEKAIHAYRADSLADLLMGKGFYYEPEAYMAPANVPTNWSRVLDGLSEATALLPNIPQKLEKALEDMSTTAEGMYSALETLLSYSWMRAELSNDFSLDVSGIAVVLRAHIPLIRDEALLVHTDWMGPTEEKLWSRIERSQFLLWKNFKIDVAYP